MERILLGDNQFFGINHMSEEQAQNSLMKFQTDEAVMEVIDGAYRLGIKVLMCTTHDRMEGICNIIRANPEKYHDFAIYPCMPYAHKYANAVSEVGMIGTLKKFLPSESPMAAAFKNGIALAKKDMEVLVKSLIDAEMKMFHGIRTPVIFLQNVVTDLLLGLGFHQFFRVFATHVHEKYNAEPGFITMNLPQLLPALEGVGIENPIVCANINKIGFRMSGGLPAYEELISTRKFRAVAMSVFASGAIPAQEALEYVCSQQNVHSVVFGSSRVQNIAQNKKIIDSFNSSR
ncbi:MAG: hypothetical protein ACXWDN_15890 [Limisphaerales bacterium]